MKTPHFKFETKFEAQFIKMYINTEAELKKSIAHKKEFITLN